MKPTEQEIHQAADKHVFVEADHNRKWSNNDDTAGDNFGSFKAGANWAISQMQPEWVAINSVDDLPTENGLYWTLRKGFTVPMYKEVFNDLDKDYWIETYSHYVRIFKPQPPTK